MKPFEQKPGKGVLFVNAKKEKETQPDYTGNILLDRDYKAGELLKIGAWRKPTPKGHLISISVDTFTSNASAQQYPRPVHDDEIPF